MSRRDVPGIAGFVVATMAVSLAISLVTGELAHWPFALAALVVSLWAVESINNK